MYTSMKIFSILLLVGVFTMAAKCGKEEPPALPAPSPEMTIPPAPSPEPSPSPSPSPERAQCTPYIPSLDKMMPVIHNNPEPDKYILDVTPKTNDNFFCRDKGFGSSPCPLGQEGDPERLICEIEVLGTDPEDGREGPHWERVSGLGTISKHPTNAWLAVVRGTGTFKACSNIGNKLCGTITIPQ